MSRSAAPSLPRLADDLRSGRRDLFAYLEESARHFTATESEVLAFVGEQGRFARLEKAARALLERFPEPAARPALFGVPVGIKDVFHVDGLPTTAGSRLPPQVLAGEQATVVTALVAAGALVLGKTVSTEFAYFAPGPTRNPHRASATPGGSSSGSAAAVAAGLTPLALGTQTIGSVSRPAAFCGVVGYKPSYERISRQGLIPLATSLDHVGTFASDVAGTVLAASLLCAGWQPPPPHGRRPVLGVPEGPYLERAAAAGRAHFEDVCRRLADAGYEIVRVPAMADFDAIEARHRTIVAAEAATTHTESGWFDSHGDLYRDKTRELIERGRQIDLETLRGARAGCCQLRDQLTAAMDAHGLDLWITPAAPGAAPEGLAATGDPVMNLPWSQAGLPTVVLPSGENDVGLPLATQLAARFAADEQLLAWSCDFEEAFA